jgi:hypothetical protein
VAVSCGPLGAPEALKPDGDPVDVEELIRTTQPSSIACFAGRLDRSLLGFGEKRS